MKSVVMVVENDLHVEKSYRGAFSTTEKACEYIDKLERYNEESNITYGIETWQIDYLCN